MLGAGSRTLTTESRDIMDRLVPGPFHGHWWRIIIILILLPTCIVLLLFVPELLVPLILLALVLLLWERVRIIYAMHNLAARIAAGNYNTKIEVQEGAWGALCHAVNTLLQQQRLHQHTESLHPFLPDEASARLLGTTLPADGTPRMLTILVVGYTRTPGPQSDVARSHLQALHRLSIAIQQQAERHNALLERCGDLILLAFGAFDETPRTKTLRSALQTMQVLRQTWDSNSPRGALTFSLASGDALAVVLPGLGYTVIGSPVAHALQLQPLAMTHPEYALLCSEEAYMTLRRLDSTNWLSTGLRLPYPDQPPQVVYALPADAPGLYT